MVYVIRPDLDKDGYEEIKEKVSSTVSKAEGKMQSWSIWKERYSLSYILRSRGAEKRKFSEGTYVISDILLDPQKLGVLKYTLDLEERILRYLVINRDSK